MRFVFTAGGYQEEVSKSRCRASVSETGRGIRVYQCTRRPKVYEKVKGHSKKLGFCKQHSTAATDKRNDDRDARIETWMKNTDRAARLEALRHACFAAIGKLTLEQACDAGIELIWNRVQRAKKKVSGTG